MMHGFAETDFEELLSDAEAKAVGEWEVQFTAEMRTRFERYAGRMLISEKQIDTLKKIAKS